MRDILRFRHNVIDVNSVLAFEGIKGGVNQNCKDVYFVRMTGIHSGLVSEICQMDADMAGRMANGYVRYRRILRLPHIPSPKEAAVYEDFYWVWKKHQKESVKTEVLKENEEYAGLLGTGLRKVTELYFSGKTANESLEKNFVVKLLYWHDFLLRDIIVEWNSKMSVKLVLSNIVKSQEYLFCYLLTLLGYDVLLLQSEADISEKEEAWGLSRSIRLGEFGKIDLMEPDANLKPVNAPKPADTLKPVSTKKPVNTSKPVSAVKPVNASKPVSTKKPVNASKPVNAVKPTNASKPVTAAKSSAALKEKSFEELALLASSVVLIAIHAPDGDVIGTGSGIMIGRDGYILTNSHVASGGRFYSIRIEDDDTVYSTDELIKYHSVLDLAVLRVDRKLNPLSIYQGNKRLVRGQKVVAIGSPLGLFNSVSDGIVSGFRKIDGVDMIQFTAPTSHGSSGGAVLNMYGEVIGISTAGFDNAQNINLAVGYESIRPFIKGFT